MPWRGQPADVDEQAYLLPEPATSAVHVATAKARASRPAPEEVVLAADTLVVDDGHILGKPAEPDEARTMLRRLRGRTHHVLTGVVLQTLELQWAAVVDTRVLMRAYTAAEVDAYVERGEPFDKAGGYAVQDETFRPVDRLVGCYLNVVGLPLCAAAAGLAALGIRAEPAAGLPPCTYCARGAPLVALRRLSTE